jgi:hypothetical protein
MFQIRHFRHSTFFKSKVQFNILKLFFRLILIPFPLFFLLVIREAFQMFSIIIFFIQ